MRTFLVSQKVTELTYIEANTEEEAIEIFWSGTTTVDETVGCENLTCLDITEE